MKKLIYHQYWIKCGNCHEESRFPVYEHDGFMLMRNPENLADVRLVSWEDSALAYVSRYVKKFKDDKLFSLVPDALIRKRLINENLSKMLFNAICDSQSGVNYVFNASVRCPHCLTYVDDSWGPTESPYETLEANFTCITHDYWDSLSEVDKETLLGQELAKIIDTLLGEFKEVAPVREKP